MGMETKIKIMHNHKVVCFVWYSVVIWNEKEHFNNNRLYDNIFSLVFFNFNSFYYSIYWTSVGKNKQTKNVWHYL